MSDFLKLVGIRLRELRKLKGLSQAELAERAETQDTYIGGVERGERNISLKTLERVTLALDKTVSDVFAFGDIRDDETLTEKELVLEVLQSLLKGRSLGEVKMVNRIVRDLFTTIDEEQGRSN